MQSPNSVQQTLINQFGFDSLREGQQQVIDTVLSGQSCAAIFPTGSGKSLCYQLPALHLPHLTLVISPLLALMKDQLAFLHSKGVPAASIDSSQERLQIQQTMQEARDGRLKILMISVERLKNERFRQFISQVPISMLVVDEAHCISEWGHNFRPDYMKLPSYLNQLNIPQSLLLTATATPNVIADMQSKFNIAPENTVVTGFYRSNLDLDIQPCAETDKPQALEALIEQDPTLPTIVYVTLQKTAEEVATMLSRRNINALAYHAGLKSDVRESIQQRFMNGEVDCIVATIAFGMGVDKANIRRVVHFDLPKSIESYSQEIGRAGRDGLPSNCTMLANQSGLTTLENFVYGDTPDLANIKTVVDDIYQHQGQWETVLSRLSSDSNIRQLALKTLLVYLELENVIEPTYSYFAEYRFKFNQDRAFICQQFEGERRQFVEAIFECSPKARTWCQVDFDALWMNYQADRQRAITAIDYFHEKGWIELESKQVTDVYKIVSKDIPNDELAAKLHQLFKAKEQAEISRIQEMLSFFQSEQCLSSELARYFSDNNAPQACGHCSVCRGNVASLPAQTQYDIDDEQLGAWISPFISKCEGSVSDEAIARFLCGITTPLSTKVRARSMSGFSTLEHVPFAEVIQAVSRIRD
ncbi:RecQ family ATP-dependent DNA helicase [Vibrio mexicanus]|uniref:RecQ family ATP-dependent DNA helicase n=1 Tax=Vibrio mexicanus TaxID=1004326 RepID=UPI00063C6A46|nr:RecQ family ATP-dependent DNA helicase [Vibrio mexicanus]